MTPLVVDVDDPTSWPEPLRAEAVAIAADLRGTTEYVSDLQLPEGCDERFRTLLRDSRLLAYHATRLLPYELEAVRRVGLRPLTRELVHDRLDDAHGRGLLSDEQRRLLESGSVYSKGEAANRMGQVCLFLGNDTFESSAGLWRLLATWGGEAIYWNHEQDSGLVEQLRALGDPAVVVAGLRSLDEGWRTHSVWPELPALFVGTLLELQTRRADVFYRAPIPGTDVLDVWVPGDAEFDVRLGWL